MKVTKHSPDWIKQTVWAKTYGNDDLYQQAIKLLAESNYQVILYSNNETGETRTAILAVKDDSGFWIDSFETKAEATALCKTMGWRIVT